jgi:hypothetical protein
MIIDEKTKILELFVLSFIFVFFCIVSRFTSGEQTVAILFTGGGKI